MGELVHLRQAQSGGARLCSSIAKNDLGEIPANQCEVFSECSDAS